jgi:hypothetical protein
MPKVRVTSRTDTRGTVNADLRGLYEVQALAQASRAGVPSHLLDPGGWNGDEDDLRGLFAEQVYRVGEVNWTAPDAIAQLAEPIGFLERICHGLGVDPRAALAEVYDLARFKRQLAEGRERHNARRRGEVPELPRDLAPSDYVEGQW